MINKYYKLFFLITIAYRDRFITNKFKELEEKAKLLTVKQYFGLITSNSTVGNKRTYRRSTST